MDYYDYNVTNASAAPGSYFSISHLMWIPSLLRSDFEDEEGEEGERINEDDEEEEETDADGPDGRRLSATGGDEGIDPGSQSATPESEGTHVTSLGYAIPMSDEDTEMKSDAEDGKDNKITEKKQIAAAQYYKNYYDQMDDIQFADEEEGELEDAV